jgi:hypothetical protein
MANKGLFWDRQYEIIDLNMKNLNLSDVSMPPQRGETLASQKLKIDDVIQERLDLDKVNKDDEQSDWQYYATVLNVGNETIQLYNENTDKKWRVLPGDLYEEIDTGLLRVQPKNKVKSTKTKASEDNDKYTVWVGGVEVNDNYLPKEKAESLADEYKKDGYDDVKIEKVEASNKIKSEEKNKYLVPGGRNGLADVMATYIFGDDYKSAYESLVRQMSDDEFLSGYNYIKRMSWDGEEGSEEENMLNEAEKEFFQE